MSNCVICGRTMEFSEPLNSKITIIFKGKKFVSITPSGYFEWISRF